MTTEPCGFQACPEPGTATVWLTDNTALPACASHHDAVLLVTGQRLVAREIEKEKAP